ncbi:Eukaryotic translation termination factor 1 [Operophtera brumata]|uniref:Eukaryotic peptide chain release factor subunit 1 n=1 Tax=Operophtera brumata TaxID=104452 RepID=A0A0L7L8Y8_OPEBR|nr:Eukaryotic translation termination factor 1 [Operophtera brumata]
MYSTVPPNGLVIYCGTIVTEEGKEKKVNIDFEPFKPINTSLYLCDNKFHTEALTALLADDNKFGFIVMDGNGALFGTLQGNTREVLHKFTVDLPKKHGRGGQSALRFARLRMEKRHNYVRKVAEVATQLFISADRPNVAGLILAGSADFKTELSQSDMFDPRRPAQRGLILAGSADFKTELSQSDMFDTSGVELELVECQPLLEWLANNYKSFGATLEIITDKSQEGSQFVRGFGGIGGKN